MVRLVLDSCGGLELVETIGHEIYLDEAKICQEKFLDFLQSLKK